MEVRAPAVAGSFYPADPGTLRAQIEALLARVEAETAPRHEALVPKALIVPHAGYVYSGAVAAIAYARLRPARARIRRVLLLGPAHRTWFTGLAVPTADALSTPLGPVPIDIEARRLALELPGVILSDAPHHREHSLEVQLPFLQVVLDDFRVLPMVVGEAAPARVAAIVDRFWDGPETLIVVSSDLSHFHRYEVARSIDAATSRRITDKATNLRGEEACGAAPINGLMASAGVRDLQVEPLELRSSGDTFGDRDRVVGYGAYALC